MQLIPLTEEAASMLGEEVGFTAEQAYRLGSIDGRFSLPDAARHAAPFEAAYRMGYESVQGLALGTEVRLSDGMEGVISGRIAHEKDCRYRISSFNRRCWRIEHRWVERRDFCVIQATAVPTVRPEPDANGANERGEITIGSRVRVLCSTDPYHVGRLGTVLERHAGSGALRVDIDLAWMHDWLQPCDLEIVNEAKQTAASR